MTIHRTRYPIITRKLAGIAIMALIWSAVVGGILSPTCSAAPTPALPPMRAMWIYEADALLASPPARVELFQFCQPRRITDLFLDTHFEARDGSYQIRDAAGWQNFIRDATRQGLRIHALAGDPSWVFPANHDKVLACVEALAAFNKTAGPSERFAGLHFDIEPHALPEWRSASEERKRLLLTQFVELNMKIVDRLHARSPGTLYGADIAFWLDKVKEDGTPAYPVTFRGTTKDATKFLLDVVDNLGLMSYRDKTEGSNGIISLVARSISYADTARGRAFVGVKMAKIGGKMESFFGHTEQEMNTELRKVDEAYGSHRGYAGLAFFMYSAYKAMPQQTK